ncbi:uncharacterized protein B0P05DRAFT_508268 [Gilbertella persicaria]|uniref:J domain-containing protein n=1 Tax=Rhizopus stolonifer TaxID=4846 RepID=A0A367JQD5_RHIST|nr:uncharacterized protein B0P05DRAFT_508268 [Gilbertella persicaria]KAI8082495.1 hypothetical protein B0P05DRAFT_508268 [Gilbertella persicaria]RCH92162.1 hypothetical protein CU098_008313 [Rhizopus stolonifer]
MSTLATEEDLDKYFSQTEKQIEIDRVLSCFKLDPFSILELPYSKPDPKAIKIAYRKKSLMIHPDKVKHERAQDAFALLKKAESELTDETRLGFLMTVIEEARVEVLRDNGFKVKTQAAAEGDDIKSITDEKEYPYLQTPEGQAKVKEKVKEILFEMELRRRKQLKKEMEAQGEEKRKVEEMAKERKRKAEESKQWEASRDNRVNSWRDFQKKGGKKVKKLRKSGL